MKTKEVTGALTMFCIYADPKDYPGKFVVRRWHATLEPTADASPHLVTETLDEARRSIPRGLIRMERYPKDDPCIVEVWM